MFVHGVFACFQARRPFVFVGNARDIGNGGRCAVAGEAGFVEDGFAGGGIGFGCGIRFAFGFGFCFTFGFGRFAGGTGIGGGA